MREKKVIDLGDIDEKIFLDEDSSGFRDNREVIVEEKEVPPFEAEGEKPPFEMQENVGLPVGAGFSDVEGKIASLEDKMAQIDSAIANVRRTNEDTDEKLGKIEKSLEGMLSVYELVTNEVNPFVEERGLRGTMDMKTSVLVSEKTVPAAEVAAKPKEEICLTKISNEPSFVMLMLKWLDFLLERAGYMGMIKVLLYYEDLGWISEAVRGRMIKYSRDLGAEKKYAKGKGLTVRDHIVSLYFITKLQGIKLDAGIYSSVVGELENLGMLE